MSNSADAPPFSSPKWRRVVPVISLVVVMAGVIGYGLSSQKAKFRNGGWPLAVDVTDLDFGEVWADYSFPWKLRVTNTSRQTVVISRIQTTCGCISVSPDYSILAPGESTCLDLLLDLTGVTAASQEPVSFSVTLIPHTAQALPSSIKWTVQGRVRSAVPSFPKVVDFGEILQDAKNHRKADVITVSDENDTVELLTVPEWAKCSFNQDEKNRLDWILSAQLAPEAPLPLGETQSPVTFIVKSPQGASKGRYTIQVAFVAIDDVYFEPRAVIAGTIHPGVPYNATITIGSRSGRTLIVESVLPQSRGLEVIALGEKSPSEHPFLFRLSASKNDFGLKYYNAMFRIRDPDGKPRTLGVTAQAFVADEIVESNAQSTR